MTGMLNFVFLLVFVSKIGTSISGHVNALITDSTDSYNTNVSQRNEIRHHGFNREDYVFQLFCERKMYPQNRLHFTKIRNYRTENCDGENWNYYITQV